MHSTAVDRAQPLERFECGQITTQELNLEAALLDDRFLLLDIPTRRLDQRVVGLGRGFDSAERVGRRVDSFLYDHHRVRFVARLDDFRRELCTAPLERLEQRVDMPDSIFEHSALGFDRALAPLPLDSTLAIGIEPGLVFDRCLARRAMGELSALEVGMFAFELGIESLDVLHIGSLLGLGLTQTATNQVEVRAQLIKTRSARGDGLLQTGDLGTESIEASLYFVERLVRVGARLPFGLQKRVDLRLLGVARFHLHLRGSHDLALAVYRSHGFIEAQQRELRALDAFLVLECRVLFGRHRRAFELRELTIELTAQVGQPLEVLDGVADAVFRLASTFTVLRDPRGFFEVATQFVRLRLDELTDHALLDDRVAARAEAGPQEHVLDVPTSAFLPVQVVGRLGFARDFAPDRDFGVLGELTADANIGVIEGQFDRGERCRRSGVRSVEDDVGEGFTTQLPCRALAHDPTHGIDDVRLATAVRTHDGGPVTRQRTTVGSTKDLNPASLICLSRN